MRSFIFSVFLLMVSVSMNFCSLKRADSKGKEDISIAEKPKILWLDATANFERFSYQDSITYYLNKAKNAGFNQVVLCVRPVSGDVLYKKGNQKEITEWNGFARNNDWDYLDFFIQESRKLGLTIYASMNVFSGGHNFVNDGIVFRDEKFAALTTVLNNAEGFTDIKKLKNKYSVFFNPVNPEVQAYVLGILKDLVTNYDLDGVILDRARFDSLGSDFSETSKKAFEEYIGFEVENFPADIYSWIRIEQSVERVNGKLFNKWIEWRAKVIYDFFNTARNTVKQIKPQMEFGTYTGAWYPTYFNEGVNWASQKFDASAEFNWATPEYKSFGYTGLLDVYMTGVYYKEIEGDGWYSVKGGLANAKRITMGDVPVTGGLYVDVYKDNPEQFKNAVKACLTESDGLMVFDIVHLIMFNFWDEAKAGIEEAIQAERTIENVK